LKSRVLKVDSRTIKEKEEEDEKIKNKNPFSSFL